VKSELADADTLALRGGDASLGAAAGTVLAPLALLETTVPLAADADTHDGPLGFPERLGWYRELTLGVLTEFLPRKEPNQHLYELVKDFVAQPSKGLRPALCLATCRAYGGSTSAALPSAAGLELMHNAFLVHDDIEDGSLSRRGQATLHRRVGVPLAVNTGDAMNALAMRLFRGNLHRLSPGAALRIIDEVDHMLVESLEGQAMELGWIRDHDCTIGTDDYLRMVLKKTAWYSFIHPMRIGALIAEAPGDLDRFNRFGFLLGASFQIQDDVLNLVGNASRYGKEIGGDLYEGKRSLVLSHALATVSARDRSRLEDFLGRPGGRRLEREVAAVQEMLHDSGSIDWARRSASALLDAARRELPVAYAGARCGPDMSFVQSIVDYVAERDR
ncbi:MAG TPA: polyprenyl synthetase family protein, partial [Gaiellaceae bacterium]|nr:polyprenyl synthetase family protein [Gaiellaceae bacterium]